MSEPARPAPGLHLVATPIGRARDITLHALDVLAGADTLACEDTRSLRRLMQIHGLGRAGRPLLSYHDQSAPAVRTRLLGDLAAGRTVAYASEAGSPLIADPGFRLVREAIEAGHSVHAAPGPSAPIAALSVAGLATDRALFTGFPPHARAARRRWLQDIAAVPATLVILESPRRVSDLLADMTECLGAERRMALCREMTKRHEETRRGTIAELREALAGTEPRGEIVLVVERAPERPEQSEDMMEEMLMSELASHRLSDAVARVSRATGLPRRRVYSRALQLREDER